MNEHVGPLPAELPDRRGRFDTIGRTVYFAERASTAFAEVLQDFRAARVALQADADAIGMSVEEYIANVCDQAAVNGRERPWAVSADWQMSRSLHRVAMPAEGWWVHIHHRTTLNRLGLDLAEPLRQAGVPLLTLSGTTSENRAVTTLLAQHVRGQTLFDGSLPLGIQFTSTTGYGTCWAWWDRRADDGLTPGQNDPKTIDDLNIDGAPFRAVTTDWELEVLPGALRY
ncbi:hypothetical protein MF406_02815 [Georgenia sp. TF02-10]|uniref:hypothetical protein n=1 Tax=Georgenia sp. TF02-10 TaxID=2917725 RepID=UPI001FA7358C|nr:hypothetical protein [Georgenia sp. TF02-10]UNX55229.1 hypothetical protein MF406_02815 [Georgenia sp. TF02-10]